MDQSREGLESRAQARLEKSFWEAIGEIKELDAQNFDIFDVAKFFFEHGFISGVEMTLD